MKRILFIFLISVAITGCDKKTEKTESAENDSTATDNNATARIVDKDPDCLDLSEYDAIDDDDLAKKVAWLKEFGASVCKETLWSRARSEHKVDPSIFTPRENTSSVTKTWAQMKELMGKYVYEYYITFNIDNHNITDVITTNEYKKKPFCFSMPLFNSIGDNMKLTNNSEFTFIPAKRLNDDDAVYFTVVKKDDLGNQIGQTEYFDLSDNPKSLGKKRILSPL